MFVRRFLVDDHDDHDHDDHAGEHTETDKVLLARVLMCIFVFLAGSIIFIPYTKCVKKKDD